MQTPVEYLTLMPATRTVHLGTKWQTQQSFKSHDTVLWIRNKKGVTAVSGHLLPCDRQHILQSIAAQLKHYANVVP
eukprot:5871-Heterococcus_DN1.PRE.4